MKAACAVVAPAVTGGVKDGFYWVTGIAAGGLVEVRTGQSQGNLMLRGSVAHPSGYCGPGAYGSVDDGSVGLSVLCVVAVVLAFSAVGAVLRGSAWI